MITPQTAGIINLTVVMPVIAAAGSCPIAFAIYPVAARVKLIAAFASAMPALFENPFRAAIVPFIVRPVSRRIKSVISVIIMALNGMEAVANMDAIPEQINKAKRFPFNAIIKILLNITIICETAKAFSVFLNNLKKTGITSIIPNKPITDISSIYKEIRSGRQRQYIM